MAAKEEIETTDTAKEKKGNASSPVIKVATFIVDRRNLFFLLFIIGAIISLVTKNWVKVENSLAAYLPDTTETSRGLDLMEEQFVTYGSAKVMVMNIPYSEAERIADRIEKDPRVSMLGFDGEKEHYNNFSALYDITFIYPSDDDRALEALEDIEEGLSGYDLYVSTSLGDAQAEQIEAEMQVVSLIVTVIVLTVLIFTSQTYAEVPVLIITFLASAILSAGTNFLLGTISFVSNSVTIVLQLALSVDYAVIFCNRYKEEHKTLDIREADIIALSKAIPEIFSSCLTTVGGLVAMMFMQYGVGRDMAICLIKAISFSILSVFLLMPGLIMIFGPLMDKTKHRNFVPRINFVGRFDYATRHVVPLLFLLVVLAAMFLQNNCPYVYGYSKLVTPIKNDTQIADEMIEESFGDSNFVALMVPAGNYEKEGRMIDALLACPEVKSVTGLASTEAMDGYMLTDKLTARQLSELLDLDYEVAELLYTAYAVNDENYAKLINGLSSYSVPLIDMVMFAFEEVKEGYVTLDDDLYNDLKSANDKMQLAKDQLQGEDYSRMLVYLNLPQEGDETFAFLDRMHEIGDEYYGEGETIIAGESTSQYDLMKTFNRDNIVVSVGSVLIVLAVLLFTFMSAGMPVLLIAVIQGAIWMNFAFPTIMDTNIFFLSELIVSSIQMGANIDYAIVISGRFLELKDRMPRKEAITETLNFAFPTIVTSGSMMTLAGVFIGQLSSDGAISGVGQCIGRGTIISIVLVMFVLPQILLVGEKIIDKTSFKMSVPIKLDRGFGLVRVDGMVRGNINGTVIGEMNAVVRGEVNALVTLGKMETISEEDALKELAVKEGDVQ